MVIAQASQASLRLSLPHLSERRRVLTSLLELRPFLSQQYEKLIGRHQNRVVAYMCVCPAVSLQEVEAEGW